MGRGLLLWLIGIPLPIILLIWLGVVLVVILIIWLVGGVGHI